MKKNLLFLMVLVTFMLTWCWTWTSDSRQWWYYKWWLDDSDMVRWPIFNNYEACKDWALWIQSKAAYWYARCSKNCHDTKAWIPQCEDVVRTWKPLPTSKIFEWITEDQLWPSRVCSEPKNNFWIWTDMYKWYQYAENWWDCNELWDTDMWLWCSYYFYDIITYLWCINQCTWDISSEEYSNCAFWWFINENWIIDEYETSDPFPDELLEEYNDEHWFIEYIPDNIKIPSPNRRGFTPLSGARVRLSKTDYFNFLCNLETNPYEIPINRLTITKISTINNPIITSHFANKCAVSV